MQILDAEIYFREARALVSHRSSLDHSSTSHKLMLDEIGMKILGKSSFLV